MTNKRFWVRAKNNNNNDGWIEGLYFQTDNNHHYIQKFDENNNIIDNVAINPETLEPYAIMPIIKSRHIREYTLTGYYYCANCDACVNFDNEYCHKCGVRLYYTDGDVV